MDERIAARPKSIMEACKEDAIFAMGVNDYEQLIDVCPIVCPTRLRERWWKGWKAADAAKLPRVK